MPELSFKTFSVPRGKEGKKSQAEYESSFREKIHNSCS